MKKHNFTTPVLRITYCISVILFVLTLANGYLTASHQANHIRPGEEEMEKAPVLMPLNEDWTLVHANGKEIEVSLPMAIREQEEGVILRKDITGLFHDGDVIKFDTSRQQLIVSVDGTPIYETNTTSLIRQVIYYNRQIVSIPNAANAKELTVELINADSDMFMLPVFSYGNYYAARNDLVYSDIFTLLALIILGIFCFVVFVAWAVCFLNKLESVRMLDLAIFILTAIFWGFADSNIAVITGLPQEFLGLLAYLSLMMLPLPICHFVWVSCGRNYRAFSIVSYICEANIIGQIVLSSMGMLQLHKTLYISHAMIIVVIVISLMYITKEKDRFNSADMRILQYGIIFLAFVALLSLLIYWQIGGLYYRCCMLIGIFVFSLILFAYVVAHYSAMLRDSQLKEAEGKIHEQLSMYDALTGLPNRRSFERKLEEIEANASGNTNAVLVMLDVNGLKIVNDQFGHNAGDDLIIAAGKVIKDTYGREGTCYRIGGDEFVVIMTDYNIPMSTYDRLLDENIADANVGSRWKISIARGISFLVNDFGQRMSISDWKQEADVNMYRNKVAMTGSQNRDRAKDLSDVINCIISTIEAKDYYTAAHSERVRELSCCIAEKLGLSGSTIQNIELASHLHDIGKVGIPDYVLLKPGKLNDEEYEILKKHCGIGAGILSQAKGMQEIANIVLHHHERWDGMGYPEGLRQTEIPIESRIIAVADSIDAITSKRVYRDRMSVDECREEIQKNTGRMYDPAVVQIAMENWSAIVDIIMLHPKRLIDGPDDNVEEQYERAISYLAKE